MPLIVLRVDENARLAIRLRLKKKLGIDVEFQDSSFEMKKKSLETRPAEKKIIKKKSSLAFSKCNTKGKIFFFANFILIKTFLFFLQVLGKSIKSNRW